MKKWLFVIVCCFAVIVWQKHYYISPIEPDIIGTGNVQYDSQHMTWFVPIDSIQYTIKYVDAKKQFYSLSHLERVAPTKGMLVTIFISPQTDGNQAVKGKCSAQEIVQLITDTQLFGTIIIVLIIIILSWFIVIIEISEKEKEKKEDRWLFNNGWA